MTSRRLESVFPPLLLVSGLGVLVYGAISQHGIYRLAVVAYLLWTLAESRVTFRGNPGETGGDDAGSMPLYGVARFVVAAAAILGGHPAGWAVWQTVALVVFVAAVVLRLGAIRYLGRFYSHKVRTLSDHEIIRSGPYRVVRHPAYTGMLLAHVGFVAAFANPFAIVALLGFFLPALINRILVEERTLMPLSGYAEYAAGRPRLVPLVW